MWDPFNLTMRSDAKVTVSLWGYKVITAVTSGNANYCFLMLNQPRSLFVFICTQGYILQSSNYCSSLKQIIFKTGLTSALHFLMAN